MERAEASQSAEAMQNPLAQRASPAKINTNNNTYNPFTNMDEIGRGSSKLVMRRKSNKNHLYIRPLPEDELNPTLKRFMKEDYEFSLKLYTLYPLYFPEVSEAWETRHTFNYKKQRCVRINDNNITLKILQQIIDAANDLLDKCRLFTFDLKPPNVGLLYGRIVFIDFGPDCSFKLFEDCDTTDYKSLIILILLIYCYNYTEIPRKELTKLANKYIKNYKRFFEGYDVNYDRNIDLDFNRTLAPSYKEYTTPIEYLQAYANGNFEVIERFFFS
jgi:hypothetical protein